MENLTVSNRSQQIAMALTKAILSHRLLPGTKLGERDLTQVFDASRVVVRQALIRVSEDGLATIQRNRGAFVAKPSLQEALDVYDTLTLLEQGIAQQLVERLGPSGWTELRHHVERQRIAIDSNNNDLADQLGRDFHALFVRLSRNRVVQEVHARLVRRTTLMRTLLNADFDYCNLLDEHLKIVELLEKGRVRRAQKLIEIHHRNVARGLIMEDSVQQELSLREAITPFLDDMPDDLNTQNRG